MVSLFAHIDTKPHAHKHPQKQQDIADKIKSAMRVRKNEKKLVEVLGDLRDKQGQKHKHRKEKEKGGKNTATRKSHHCSLKVFRGIALQKSAL